MRQALSVERTWLSGRELERRALAALRILPAYRDLTGIDVEAQDHGPAGTWHVARLWRGHVVELPCGPSWDAAGRGDDIAP